MNKSNEPYFFLFQSACSRLNCLFALFCKLYQISKLLQAFLVSYFRVQTHFKLIVVRDDGTGVFNFFAIFFHNLYD